MGTRRPAEAQQRQQKRSVRSLELQETYIGVCPHSSGMPCPVCMSGVCPHSSGIALPCIHMPMCISMFACMCIASQGVPAYPAHSSTRSVCRFCQLRYAWKRWGAPLGERGRKWIANHCDDPRVNPAGACPVAWNAHPVPPPLPPPESQPFPNAWPVPMAMPHMGIIVRPPFFEGTQPCPRPPPYPPWERPRPNVTQAMHIIQNFQNIQAQLDETNRRMDVIATADSRPTILPCN